VTAHCLRQIAKSSGHTCPSGIYHLCASGAVSWHQLAVRVIQVARVNGLMTKATDADVAAISTSDYPTPARRPKNSRLETEKLRRVFDVCLPDWIRGLDRVVVEAIPTLVCEG
jgi:dTDP-4-dehydrorhamnose reductase